MTNSDYRISVDCAGVKPAGQSEWCIVKARFWGGMGKRSEERAQLARVEWPRANKFAHATPTIQPVD